MFDKKGNWKIIEDKLLWMVQIWADTVMMHEDQFPHIHATYRQLRKEKVEFPKRNPNEKFMINFEGVQSPVYLAMESNQQ